MMRFHSRSFDKSFLACYTNTVKTGHTEKEVTIMAKRISCEYNIDTACVEIKYDNGVTVSIDCIAVENTIPRNTHLRYIDWLIHRGFLCRLAAQNCGLCQKTMRHHGCRGREIYYE